MLMNISQGAKLLGVSPEHIRRQIRAGRWPYYRLGEKALRIDVDEIQSLARMISEVEQNQRRGTSRHG
jgi:excisionase family DNA binding protein